MNTRLLVKHSNTIAILCHLIQCWQPLRAQSSSSTCNVDFKFTSLLWKLHFFVEWPNGTSGNWNITFLKSFFCSYSLNHTDTKPLPQLLTQKMYSRPQSKTNVVVDMAKAHR